MTFEEKMKRLEEISEQIKSGAVDFTDQLDLYKEGATLAEDIEKELSQAEHLIEEIGDSDQGEK
ncbi:exodeoxyribonuclease VII small subunit [Oceanispirochaeta sp.]|uniref:exodeoxyribonuclease VII small subunit n=1 Tax=Oceanispirochaeta sp. TaxID=2035350 RepID=UPI0026029D15|nr:exodeoxyribonuclease VII small subunit [Oceanispirochaeta sp.]MDA3956990.1 exodeoxyribonuclease VII small subunit [Oceanispirochaeta sp.]